MRTWVAAAAATLLGAAFMVAIRLPGMNDMAVLLLSNGGQLVAAMAASARLRRCRATYHRPPSQRLVVAVGRHRLLGGRAGGLELLRGGARPQGPVSLVR